MSMGIPVKYCLLASGSLICGAKRGSVMAIALSHYLYIMARKRKLPPTMRICALCEERSYLDLLDNLEL